MVNNHENSHYQWRSGVKHDCAKILELDYKDRHFINKLKQKNELEDNYVSPFLKCSDLNKSFTKPRKWAIITQRKAGEKTDEIEIKARKTWDYLNKNISYFKARKSKIYRDKPDFSIFGVREYSFSPWKIAIS